MDIRYKLELLEIILRLVRQKNLAVISVFHELGLARRIADTVICVKNGHAERAENAGEAFRPEHISSLFDISEEQYRWLQGTDELL